MAAGSRWAPGTTVHAVCAAIGRQIPPQPHRQPEEQRAPERKIRSVQKHRSFRWPRRFAAWILRWSHAAFPFSRCWNTVAAGWSWCRWSRPDDPSQVSRQSRHIGGAQCRHHRRCSMRGSLGLMRADHGLRPAGPWGRFAMMSTRVCLGSSSAHSHQGAWRYERTEGIVVLQAAASTGGRCCAAA